jgi:predicted Rossmann fold nucleotide-binding protein DprA/Smf involved in DNA uptake
VANRIAFLAVDRIKVKGEKTLLTFLEQLKNAECIEKNSALYPKAWTEFSDAPEKLYAVGNTSLLAEKQFVIVGSRRTPVSALKIGAQIAKEISQVFTVTTGTADGGDGAAIEGAILGSGKVICLLAGGFSAIPQGNLPL